MLKLKQMFLFDKKEKIFVILDIGSGSVGGFLVRDGHKNGLEILASIRSDIKRKEDTVHQPFHRSMEGSLRKVMKFLRNKTNKAPDFIFCVPSSLLYVAQTRIIRINKEKSFEVNKRLLDDLIEIEVKIFKKTYANKSESSYLGDEADMLEHDIMKSILNGYDTVKPLGKKARQLDLYVYMSMCNAKIKEKIVDIINENFAGSPVVFRTFPFVVFNMLKDHVNNKQGFMLVDISDEVTDISLIRKGILEETISFPIGRNFVLRKIGKTLNTLIKETSSVFSRLERGHSEESATKKISKAMNEAKDEWSEVFKKAIGEIAENSPLPQNLFLVGNDKVIEEFSSLVEDNFFAQFSILGKPFDVEKISLEFLDKSFDLASGVRKEKDVFLVLEMLYARKFL